MQFELMDLPFAKDALAPHISADTLGYHYGKHHQGYLTKLKATLDGDDRASLSLEEIIQRQDKDTFNNAAQVWNHDFYWLSIDPTGASKPSDALAAAIDDAFGSMDNLKQKLKDVGATTFGSGWVWLCVDDASKKLVVTSTSNAETPVTEAHTPLLTIDVWEHAYYLDHQNNRPGYLDAFVEQLINWQFASDNFASNR